MKKVTTAVMGAACLVLGAGGASLTTRPKARALANSADRTIEALWSGAGPAGTCACNDCPQKFFAVANAPSARRGKRLRLRAMVKAISLASTYWPMSPRTVDLSGTAGGLSPRLPRGA
jgi:hypothetical protein